MIFFLPQSVRVKRVARWQSRLFALFPFVWFGAVAPLAAQESSEPATRVAFFNALPAEVPLFVKWNQIEAFRDGVGRGQAFGPFNVPAQNTSAVFTAEGFKEAEASINLDEDTRRAFIIYAGEAEPPSVSEPKPVRPLKIFSTPPLLEAAAGKQLEWPLVLVGLAPSAQVQVNGKPVSLTRNKSVVVGKGERYVEVKQGDRELLAVSVEGPEDYVLVVFGDDPEKLDGGVVYR